MSVMGVCVSTLHRYDWAMSAIGQKMSVMDLCFSTFHLYPGHLINVGQQSASHRVVFSTIGLYACPFSQAGQQIVHQGLACFNLHFFQIYSSVSMVEFSWGMV